MANMKPRAALHQSAPSASARDIKGSRDLAAGAKLDLITQPNADQRIMGEA
jgi:hypothetical protein